MSRCACPGGMGEDCRLEERGEERGAGGLALAPSPPASRRRGAGSGAVGPVNKAAAYFPNGVNNVSVI